MSDPMFPKLRGWLFPKTDDNTEPVVPPAPTPAPAPPDPPPAQPSAISLVNYIRALSILRKLPFKKFSAELAKLPKKQIALIIGTLIWLYMTYTYATAILNWLL